MQVTDTYFNPPYYTLPLGGNIAFQKQSAGTQTFSTISGALTSCAFDAVPAFSLSVDSASANGTTILSPSFQGIGSINYGENSKCATGMYGTVNVIGATPTSQTFCQKCVSRLVTCMHTPSNSRYSLFVSRYTTALFGTDNAVNEAALINATVQYAVPKLYTDPATAAWFNGTNNGIDFGNPANSAALNNLVNHLIGFFGFALGCTAPGFSDAYPVTTPDMTGVHSGFRVPINKAAYERFNQVHTFSTQHFAYHYLLCRSSSTS